MNLTPHLTCALLLFSAGAVCATPDPAPAQRSELSDAEIRAALIYRLNAAAMIAGDQLTVTCGHGVVTLAGQQPHLLGRRRAVRIAQTVKGVRSVVDRIEVLPSDQSDATIQAHLVAALASDPATEPWEVQPTVREGVVTLRGQVQSFAERELTESVCLGVEGVREIQNELRVDAQSARSDAELRAEIERRLTWDTRVEDGLIEVHVVAGRVTLQGAVGSAFERRQARWLAWVRGVKHVDTARLEVRWYARNSMKRTTLWPEVSDAKIVDAINAAFAHDPRVQHAEVQILAESGVVTLRGALSDLKAKHAAGEDARNTLGVWEVRNELEIEPELRDPSAIKSEVEAALRRSAWVRSDGLMVLVTATGQVKLLGEARSHFERAQAADEAARIRGVTAVHNDLTVSYAFPFGSTAKAFADWDPLRLDYLGDRPLARRALAAEALRDAIEERLRWLPFLEGSEVAVSVKARVATLRGHVDTWTERSLAETCAFESGAREVVNLLECRFGPPWIRLPAHPPVELSPLPSAD